MIELDFEPALRQELIAIPEVHNRVYPLDAPEATKHNGVPYIIYSSSEGLRDKAITEGYLSSKEVRGEINVIAERYSEMKAITKKVIAILLSFPGRQIGSGGPYIDDLTYEMPVELYEVQAALYRCPIEFSVFYKED